MKAILPAALVGAMIFSPAWAGGGQKGDQRSEAGMPQSAMSDSHSGNSAANARQDPQTVRQVQQQLRQQGYDVGQIDGKLGPQTKQALQDFQRDQNLPGSGQLDQQTIAALGNPGSSSQQAEMPADASRGSPGSPSGQGSDGMGRATTNTNSPDMSAPDASSVPGSSRGTNSR